MPDHRHGNAHAPEVPVIGRAARRRRRDWQRREPALAGLDPAAVRTELRHPATGRARQDALLAALVRLAQSGDRPAAELLLDCMRPGVLNRVRRHRGRLDRRDAAAVVTAALWERICRFDTTRNGPHVAARLLDPATDSLRHAARCEGRHHARTLPLDPADVPHAAAEEMPASVLLDAAVRAGTLTPAAAALIADVDIAGRPLAAAARRAGCSYETARKRRQRTLARMATWLDPDLPSRQPIRADKGGHTDRQSRRSPTT